MIGVIETISLLKNICFLNGATNEKITEAEKELGVRFSEEYKQYTAQFGAVAIDGSEYTGVVDDPNLSVVKTTKAARLVTPQASKQWYVIKDLHIDCVIIWQDVDGKIYQTIPYKEPLQISNSMAEYIADTTIE